MKTIFQHNKKLDEQKITTSFDKVVYDTNFYGVDKDHLDLLMDREKRTSKYILPNESIPDKTKLEVIVKTINSISRYITGKPVRIQFTEVEGENYADFEGENISLSLSVMCDFRIPFHTRVDCLIGVGIHETLHVRETTPGITRLLIKKGYTKEKVSIKGAVKKIKIADFNEIGKVFQHVFQKTLLNIVEDKRIEETGLSKYSGYVFYLDELRKYAVWCHQNNLENPTTVPDYTDEKAYYHALTMYVLYSVLIPELVPLFEKTAPNDSKWFDLTSKVKVITKKTAETFEDAMQQSLQLLKLYPEEQLDSQAKKFGSSKESGSGSKPAIIKGTPLDGEGEGKMKISAADAAEIEEMMAEINDDQLNREVKDIKPQHKRVGDREYNKLEIITADEGVFDNSVYKEANEIAQSIARNLSFLDSRYNRTVQQFEMRSGQLDEDELHSIGHNKELFWDEEDTQGYSMDFGILIDESGSMSGRKIKEAQIAAMAIALAFQNNPYINLYVYGHTANQRTSAPVTMYRYYDPLERNCTNLNTMFSVKARSNNADGYAIAHMGDILAKGKSKTKVLVVASDGYPNAYNYDGDPAISHTADMVRRLEMSGVYVVQIAVENFSSSKMFSNFIPYDKKALGQNLKKVLMRKLIEISNQI
jgi:hypothetical protein